MSTSTRSVADIVGPLLTSVLGSSVPPVRFEFWDGTALGPDRSPATIRIRSAEALRHLVWAPGELGVARAFVSGEIEVEGDIVEAILALRGAELAGPAALARLAPHAARTARELGAVGRPPAPPSIEARPHGRRHSRRRDATVISHHYDVGNEFYRLVLGPAMTYSCARFETADTPLDVAQASKHELVCRKLGLAGHDGARLLDIGCGWGSMAIHAARRHGAKVVGITLSAPQAEYARVAADRAGVGHLVEIRRCDYRELRGERFDAVSSIGMFEHVGSERADEYFTIIRALLRPGGRLLNHAISSVGGSRLGRRSFMYRYIFPDGELLDVGDTVQRMERAGFEVRDVESLREHYAATLRAWIANLEADWDRAVELAGPERTRVWRLYMAGSAVGFEDGGVNIHQVLGCVPDPAGRSSMPRTRDGWATDELGRARHQEEALVGPVT